MYYIKICGNIVLVFRLWPALRRVVGDYIQWEVQCNVNKPIHWPKAGRYILEYQPLLPIMASGEKTLKVCAHECNGGRFN